jgi:uncharacterized protein with FMN-binding domain
MAKAKRKAGAARARSKAPKAKTSKKRAVKAKKAAKGKPGIFTAVANAAAWVGAKVRATVKRGKKKKPRLAKAKPSSAMPATPTA